MHFTIAKSNFLRELNIVQGVVEKKNTIPILSNLLVEAEEKGITIKGTDLDLAITTFCEAEIIKPGAICLQARKLFEIVKSLPEAEIEVKCIEQDQVLLTCERSKFRLVGFNKEAFPNIDPCNAMLVSLPTFLVSTFINRTLFAITNEESRYSLNGAKLEVSSAGVRMITTDGHRLSFIEKQEQVFDGEKIDVLIPRKTLSELAKLCAELDGLVEFGKNENHLYFRVGHRLLSSRTLTGQFPNYELVIPKDKRNQIIFEADKLSNSIKRVALMADEKSHSIKFDINTGFVKISSQAMELGDSEDVLLADYNSDPITIAFNAHYLLDFFGVIQDAEVILEVKDGNSQVLLRPITIDEFDFRYIVMPMRL
jgi:DNA polymerase III subunit beta